MKVSSVTRGPPPVPQPLSFDGARGDVAKRARAFIDGHFREPVRMEDLCRATGDGARSLQFCFRQCFDVTVTSYLKALRLDAAHRDLIAAHPSRDTVTAIAERIGLMRLGRFSSEFRERFGQLPRETLRSEPSQRLLQAEGRAGITCMPIRSTSLPGRWRVCPNTTLSLSKGNCITQRCT